MELKIIKNKKILILIVIIAGLIVAGFVYFIYQKSISREKEKSLPKERTLEQILKQDLTAPSEKEFPVSEEVMKDLTAPQSKEKIPQDILQNLTVPE